MKKLLGLLGAVGITAVSAATVVSCSKQLDQNLSKDLSNSLIKQITNTDLGSLNNLDPLTDREDANIFNEENKGTFIHTAMGYDDYSDADNTIGTYELAKQIFAKNNIDFTYDNIYGFTFEMKKDSNATNGYIVTVKSANGNFVDCKFTSTKEIQLSLNSIFDESKVLHVADGNVHTIIKSAQKLLKDNSVQLGIWNRHQLSGVDSINIDSQTGKGTIQLFDITHKYSGFINIKVVIDNYQKSNWDWNGNLYNFYNDRTVAQNKAIDAIDNTYKETPIKTNKHVILMGFDGIRFDKYMELMNKHVTENHYIYNGEDDVANDHNEYGYYSQPDESTFGWKTNLTGSIDGSSTNIFDMVNNAANGKDVDAMANFMWTDFETKVLAKKGESGLDNVAHSFKDGSYVNLVDKKYENLWLDEAKRIIKTDPEFKDVTIPWYHGTVDNQAYENGIWNATENEMKFSKLKSLATYNVSKNMWNDYAKSHNGQTPNLMFHYDTEEDDEGHAFDGNGKASFNAFYNSKEIKDTFKVYAQEMNEILAKYGNNPDYLILQIVDHGRNDADSGHSRWDPAARHAWMVSNRDDLQNYISSKNKADINQYSIKEIIWNWLTKE